MKYELELNEKPAAGIRRIIRERVDHIHGLMEKPAPSREVAVHEARKSFKRIRAALRLARETTGESWYQAENAFYRDAARLLSSARDSAVLVPAMDAAAAEFAEIVPPGAFASIRAKLVARSEAIASEFLDRQDVLDTVAGLMKDGRKRLAAMPIESAGFARIGEGLGRVYGRGREAMAAAYADPYDALKFHEWRKQVKYLWYHLEILQPVWPAMLQDMAEELRLLSDFLGEAHDLLALKEVLLAESELFGDELNLTTLLVFIDRRRRRLEEASWTLGQRIYFEKPRAFVDRIVSYWHAWHKDFPETREAMRQNAAPKPMPSVEALPPSLEGLQLLSTQEAAALLGTTTNEVRARIKSGDLQAARVGRFWVIDKSKLAGGS